MTVAVAGERILLHGIAWATHEAILAGLEGHRRLRITYDGGDLELMTLSLEHESWKARLRRLVEALTEELQVPIKSGGSTTLRSKLLERGLEPDELYWVASEPRMRGRRRFDQARDPPPDLALEVDVTRRSLDRMGIYAALGVGEVCRLTADGRLAFQVLGEDGRYRKARGSCPLPFLVPANLVRFLEESRALDETAWVRRFRAWVREELSRRSG